MPDKKIWQIGTLFVKPGPRLKSAFDHVDTLVCYIGRIAAFTTVKTVISGSPYQITPSLEAQDTNTTSNIMRLETI